MLLALAVVFAGFLSAEEKETPPPQPIRALLVTGGCSHDYTVRQEILTRGIRERVARPIEWVVRLQGLGESDVRIPLFESAEWAKDYDIVVHDHCFPRVRDTAYVDRILAPHRAGLPAVLLHGTMMSFRTGDERWFDFTGLTTRSHERDRVVRVEPLASGDPILKRFEPWEITREELYRVEKVKSGIVALTRSLDPVGQAHVTSWTHRYGPAQARVFGTTLGNATTTVADARYLDLVARGFLWSLGEPVETSFRVVPEAESLKGLDLGIPEVPLPRPGRNAVRDGEVSAFSWGAMATSEEVALTNDGDPVTGWTAATPGPGSWEVSWSDPCELGAVVVYWKGAVPQEARLEGTDDGRTWKSLSRFPPPQESDVPWLVPVSSSRYRGLRLSVDAMATGGRIGLREVAAYDSLASVPGAILAMLPAEPTAPRPSVAGDSDFLARIHLATGWQVDREGIIPITGEIGQIVPTAAGEVFLSVFPEPGSRGSVYRTVPGGESGFVLQTYLAKIDAGTRIAWDGEWLYTLSGPGLERVRKALGNGPADERQHFEAIYSLPEEGASKGAGIRDLEFGPDGWLWARVSSTEVGFVLSRDGRKVPWPLDGRLRVSPMGHGLTSERLPDQTSSANLPGGGRVEGTFVRADDGLRIWLAGEALGQKRLVCLMPESDRSQLPPDWNEVETTALPEFLVPVKGRRPSAGLEAVMEMLRRKSAGDNEPLFAPLEAALSADHASLLVTASAGPPTLSSLAHLERLVAHPDPSVQAAAYLAIGDHPASENSTVFPDLGSVTIPEVSAAIFDALRRSGTKLPGSGTVAMSLANHENARLASAAHDFLVDRGAVDLVFETLDREEARFWPGAFALLGALPSESVVDGLIARLDRSGDPSFRQMGFETLASLFQAKSRTRRKWVQSDRISDYVSRSLADRRVDAAALIGVMERHGLPDPGVDRLFELGRQDFRLEAYTIDGIIRADAAALPEGALQWFHVLAEDESRDPDFRCRVRALIVKHGPTGEYRRWFAETVKGLGESRGSESGRLLRSHWLGRSDHGENRDWLKTQSLHRDARTCGLAWASLVAGTREDAGRKDLKADFANWVADAVKAGGGDLDERASEVASAPLEIVQGFVEMTGGSPDPLVNAFAAKVASERGLDPVSGAPLPPDVGIDVAALVREVEAGGGNAVMGSELFRSRNCIDCHNPHGEGPGSGPDLVEAAKNLSLAELVEAIARPEARVLPGYELKAITLASLREPVVWSESREGPLPEWVDLAGNRFVAKSVTIKEMRTGTPCGLTERNPDLAGLRNLTAFLRGLAD